MALTIGPTIVLLEFSGVTRSLAVHGSIESDESEDSAVDSLLWMNAISVLETNSILDHNLY